MTRFYNYAKNIFFILIMLSIAPKLLETIKNEYFKNLEPHTNVGYLPIKESIYDSLEISKNLKNFLKDNDIKAILLEIDSVGGTSGTSKALFDEITSLKKEYPKPIITYTENACVSGAYYVACATDHIVASALSVVGSVGSCRGFPFNLKKFINHHNVEYNMIQSGDYKTVTDPFMEQTPEGAAYMQQLSDDAYHQFVKDVAQARKLSTTKESIDSWANGKIFIGNQALKLKLVDQVGSRSTAIEEIKKRGIVKGEIRWITPPQKGLLTKLFGSGPNSDIPETKGWFSFILGGILSLVENRYSGIR